MLERSHRNKSIELQQCGAPIQLVQKSDGADSFSLQEVERKTHRRAGKSLNA